MNTAGTLAAVSVALAAASAAAAPADWVGGERCASCHRGAAAAWAAGPHARATAILGERRRLRQCLGCHATGEAPAGPALSDGVGCEACHGPGAGYSPGDVMRDPPLRAALGLVDLSTADARARVCRRCHTTDLGLGPMDPERGWRSLPHARGGR